MAVAQEDSASSMDYKEVNLNPEGGEALVDKVLRSVKKYRDDPTAFSSLGKLHIHKGVNQEVKLSLLGIHKIKRTSNRRVREIRSIDSIEYVTHLSAKNIEFIIECPESRCFFLPTSRTAVLRIQKAKFVIELSVQDNKVMLDFVKTVDLQGMTLSEIGTHSLLKRMFSRSLVNEVQDFDDSVSAALDYFFSKLFNKTLLNNDFIE